MNQAPDYLVLTDQLGKTQSRTRALEPIVEGQIRIAIDRFALASNNITYAAFGDGMSYWRCFPVTHDDGSADPAWGFGTLNESCHGLGSQGAGSAP